MLETGETKISGSLIAMSDLGHSRSTGRMLERLTRKKRRHEYKVFLNCLSTIFGIISLSQVSVFFFNKQTRRPGDEASYESICLTVNLRYIYSRYSTATLVPFVSVIHCCHNAV